MILNICHECGEKTLEYISKFRSLICTNCSAEIDLNVKKTDAEIKAEIEFINSITEFP